MKKVVALLLNLSILINLIPTMSYAVASKNVREIALTGWSGSSMPSIKSLVGDYFKYYDDGTYSGFLYIDLDQELTFSVSDSRYSWIEKRILGDIWESGMSFGYKASGYLSTTIYFTGTVYEGGPTSKVVTQMALSGYSDSASGNASIPPLKTLISTDSIYYNDGEYRGYLSIDFSKSINLNIGWSTSGSSGSYVEAKNIGDLWTSGASTGYYKQSSISMGPIYYTGMVERIVDTTPPTVTLSKSINTKTNQDIIITANATDNEALHAQPYDWGSGWTATKTLKVSSNGTYTITVRDNFKNTTTKSITVDNIDKVPPTFFATTMSAADGNKALVAVVAQDNSMEQLSYSFDNGATWQSSHMCECEVNKEIVIQVKDTAGNVASTSFTPILVNGGNNGGSNVISVPVTVFGDVEIEGTIYGHNGAFRENAYKLYAKLNHLPEAIVAAKTTGIVIKVEAETNGENKYLSGNVKLNNKEYAIKWDNFNGSPTVGAGKHIGYVYIDRAEFTSNLKNAKMRITVGEFLDELCKTKVAEGERIIYVSVDISPPSISATHNKASNMVTVNTFDSVSGVKDVLYRIDGGAYKNYTAPFSVSTVNNTVDIVAVDQLENSAEYRLSLKQDADKTEVDSRIYTYKTQSSIIYIIGGQKTNTKVLNLSDFSMT